MVYVDVANLFGNKEAVKLWNDFYKFCVKKYKLHNKAALEGLSRGGFIVYNWAAENTDTGFCIYADAPVCDIKSWPGGLYNGAGSTKGWETSLKVYELDQESVKDFKGIPIYTCEAVIKAGIPVLHVCGDADEVVPYEENSAIIKSKFEQAGGSYQEIIKKGVGHHPHSLENPKPIVDFILRNTLGED